MSLRVLLAGGGTAGHVSPALAVAAALQRLRADVEPVFLGTQRGLEVRLVPEHGYDLELIPAVPLPRRVNRDLFAVPVRLRRTVRTTREVLERRGIDVVIGFGGYVALPAYLAARRAKIPSVVHEQNARPGLANRVAARFCTHRVGVSLPDTPLRHATFVGLPLRESIAGLDRAATRVQARASFGLAPDRPTLLVTGGSQGARRLNETVAAVAPDLAAAGVQILHAVGARNLVDDGVSSGPDSASGAPAYIRVPYIDRMDLAYAAADLTVCRAGASSVAEAAAVGLPAVFVPLPHGNGEQALNARPVVEAGGGLLVDDADFTPQWARANLVPLLSDTDRLAGMSIAASELVPADAADRVAAMVLDAAGRRS